MPQRRVKYVLHGLHYVAGALNVLSLPSTTIHREDFTKLYKLTHYNDCPTTYQTESCNQS